MRIAHLTSVHARFDIRIFHKMCSSIAAAGHEVVLIVADGLGDETRNDVAIIDVGPSRGRMNRIRKVPGRILAAAVESEMDVYHLHDPELWPIGLKLKRMGRRVIFDSHEDVPSQMLNKPYLNRATLWLVSRVLRRYESWACRRFDGIVAATPFIREKFLQINPQTVDINNYPLAGELASDIPWDSKRAEVCYVGGIGRIRGILQVIEALSLVSSPVRLNLCGRFAEADVEQSARTGAGWSRVNELGFVDRAGVRAVLGRSVAGLVTFLPLPNHIDAQPNKMFEYMSAGIPVIASNFPLWREIIHGNDCGLCVDPLVPAQIAQAMDYLVTHPEEARRMGENGRRAVAERYSWSIEEKKLLGFYERILTGSPS
jgi:glycosyltransferase involved in cell wall biosynthesis